MALTNIDGRTFLVGSGELYIGATPLEDSATIETIEASVVNIGHITAGASVTYKPTYVDVKGGNRLGTFMRFLTDEEVTFKTGIITWNQDNIAILAPATSDIDVASSSKSMKIGGDRTTLNVNVLLFVHEKADGKKLKVLIRKAQSTNGFALAFDNKEMTIDAEFTALSCTDGNLLEVIEEKELADLL
jgi:hypothetical protein